MAEQQQPKSSAAPRPFDVQTIDHLIKLMSEYELTEVHLEEGEQLIRLRRGAKSALPGSSSLPVSVSMAPAATADALAPAAWPSSASSAPASANQKYAEIKSPTPGTFYRASSPDAEPFVKVGSKVKTDTVVCIIEAMKVFNEIPAEVSGTIVAIKVEDKQPVEYGQVLFHIEPD